MTVQKICGLIIFYFISRAAFASTCDVFQGIKVKEKLCFNESVKGWMTAKCLDSKTKCQATEFFAEKKKLPEPVSVNGQNPAALYCHYLKLNIVILKDSHNNEQSFCMFADKTLVDANAIERFIR